MGTNEGDAAVAARCIADPDHARQVLEGDEHTAVRAALLDDLAEGAEVSGFFNPQPDPPGKVGDLEKLVRVQQQWGSLPFTRLRALADPSI